MSSFDVVVLGAGPAGLAAARGAAATGRSVLVVERAPVVGGMAASFDVAGVRVDHGSHRLHSAPPELRAFLGDELQTRARNGRIALEGRWVAFPVRATDLARRLPPSFVATALRDQVRRERATNDTFADVVVARLGRTMGERFYFPYARKLWGVEPHELSGEQARRRISARGAGGLLRRALRRERPTFLYPRGGFGRIVEVLADDAVARGATIRTSTSATAVDVSARRVTLDDGTTVGAGRVWSTVPLPSLARLAGAPADVLDAAARLEQRAMVLVYLVVDRPHWTAFDAHYLPGPSTPVTRVSEPKNYRDRPADPPDRTVVCAEIPCAVDDDVWTAAPGDVGARVADDLAALGLPRVTPVDVDVRRLPAAYPIYRAGFERHLAPVEAWAAAQPGLLSFGRLGLFAHDNTHHALAEAAAAVGTLTGDVDWTAARASFASHVVED
ncbi:MAG TPA: FAD-dependent oxidoreductase [Acidimicrobiales bacterium]|nr:FAD-dependent oxidoreductase [Acidimicrobiales bacterium]